MGLVIEKNVPHKAKLSVRIVVSPGFPSLTDPSETLRTCQSLGTRPDRSLPADFLQVSNSLGPKKVLLLLESSPRSGDPRNFEFAGHTKEVLHRHVFHSSPAILSREFNAYTSSARLILPI